jgi:hypothetical protein
MEAEMRNRSTRLLILADIILFTACGNLNFLQPALTPTPPPTYKPTATATSTITRIITSTATRTPTATDTSIPTKTATPTETPKVTRCSGAPDLGLKIDDWAMVSKDPALPNRVRSHPGSNAEELGSIQPGETMLVEEGPRCADGYSWWYVHSFNGLEGWTAEGDTENYWLVPLKSISAGWTSFQNAITLTADQVHSALDIEAAIKTATTNGSRPGTIILDGQKGPFIFTRNDRTVNIFVSNLTILGQNQASIQDCEDGLFLDDFPLENILVEGIEFICSGHGVWTRNESKMVVLRNNIFRTGSTAIDTYLRPSDWLITYNLIETNSVGIVMTGTERFVITHNHINANIGITIHQGSDIKVQKNILHASDQGIQLIKLSLRNLVQMNSIWDVSQSGIFLEPGVRDNQILDNTVVCAPNISCLTVDATPELAEMNTIDGNRP